MEKPWIINPLNEWDIIGMNHYYHNGQKRLLVAMVKDGCCIKKEGPDDECLWNRLWHKTNAAMTGG